MGTLMVIGALAGLLGTLAAIVLGMAGVFRATYTRDPLTGAVNDAGATVYIPYAIGLAVIGAVLFVSGMAFGFVTEHRSDAGRRQTISGVKIIARYAFRRDGTQVSQTDLDLDDEARTYVKVRLPDGTMEEYRCDRPVFYQAGEGMVGDATVQGKWLGSFSPLIGGRG